MTAHITTDQMGRMVSLRVPPRRVISLVPSQTELLFDLGLDKTIVGITKFCVHPAHARKTRAIIGGTKKFDLDRIVALNPDLVIGNKEENYEEGISFLEKRFPVWMSDITTMDDALSMIKSVSRITNKGKAGTQLASAISEAFMRLPKFPAMKTLYLMWYNPWMGAAPLTFIHSMMEQTGLVNVLNNEARYPELSCEQIRELDPELVLLSSEPFPFSKKQAVELRDILPHATIRMVDGEFFSWYGSRLRFAVSYFESLQKKLLRSS